MKKNFLICLKKIPRNLRTEIAMKLEKQKNIKKIITKISKMIGIDLIKELKTK